MRPEAFLQVVLPLAVAWSVALACSDDASPEPPDERCVCDAFGPPGIFDPSTCDDGEPCCDYDEDGEPDAPPTRIVCLGGAE